MTRSCCIRILVVACLVFAQGLQDARSEWQVRDLTDETTGPGVQPAVDGPWIGAAGPASR